MAEDQLAPLAAGIANRDSQNQGWPIGCYVDSDLNQVEIGLRLVIAYQVAGESTTAKRLAAMMRIWFPDGRVTMQGTAQSLQQALERVLAQDLSTQEKNLDASLTLDSARRFEWTTLGSDGQRVCTAPAPGELDGIPAVDLEGPSGYRCGQRRWHESWHRRWTGRWHHAIS